MKHTLQTIALTLFTLTIFQCSQLESNSVFSDQLVPESFVSELNSSSLQTINISHQKDSQVAWAKLTENKDFKYFQIEKVMSGSTVIVENGVGDFVANSRVQVPAMSVAASTPGENEFNEGVFDLSVGDGLQFTIRFSPQSAPKDSDKPFEATLEIYYTAPEEGLLLVNLKGYVQGFKSDKCTQNISSYEIHTYNFKDNQFGFYMCSPEVAKTQNDNAPERGTSTNFTQMPIQGQMYFYQPDDETVCLMHAENTAGPEFSSIPDFDFLIPEGLAEVDSLPISLFSTAECKVDASTKAIYCDQNVYLDTLISLSGMTATSSAVTAEELVTSQCPDFGEISGAGGVGDDALSLVIYGTILPDSITESYNIADALILGVIDLEL